MEGIKLGCFTASTLFSRSCSFRLSPVQILGILFSRQKFRIRGEHQNESPPVFDKKDRNFFENVISKLIERWKDVVRTNAKYIIG